MYLRPNELTISIRRQAITDGLKGAGFSPEVRDLNYFQDDYGLKPVDGEDEEEEDEEEEEEEEEEEDGEVDDDGEEDGKEEGDDDSDSFGGSEGYEIIEGNEI
ncbi:uncharacterized protein A1O5_05722 [Cladophialophora psammophila CBS 110553]|uniref:Uncharacterized protein n=1 Tax=Cladophialophora psammophila CBS 110553 TaxID=1182543 RepID=W9WR86_9EURO|nr:uncharacterized protein A1O5_05722 [Cladophialophora psammophila CBS 110553]EXJ70732.1 hypothetical protein A1O5_05722 [Cladophialophora psammophila CBS 110553]